MAATKREQAEKLIHDVQVRAEAMDAKGEWDAEEGKTLSAMIKEAKRLRDEALAEAELVGNVAELKDFFAGLSGAPATAKEPDVKDGIVAPTNGMTFGEAFTKSPAYTEFLDKYRNSAGSIKDGRNVESASFTVGGFDGFSGKAVVTGLSQTSGGAFTQNQVLMGTTDLIGERELTIRQLCTNININTDTFEYVTVTAKTNNAAPVIEATTAADSAVYGTPTAGNVQGYKPESDMTLAVVTSPVETIAHLIPITRRAAADAPQVRGLVDAFLLYGLREEEEDQILNGSGTSPNLRGILNTAGISTVGSAGTDIDAIVDAIRTVRVTGRRQPTAVVMHPNDWFSTGFLLAKDTQGNYLIGDPRASVEQLNSLWGLRVVISEAMTENTALVGDFRQAVVADRMQSTLYVTDSHKDWFARNILAILAEERIGFGVLDPQAFCTVTAI